MKQTQRIDSNNQNYRLKAWLLIRRIPQLSVLLILVTIFIILSISTKAFLTGSNLVNILRQASSYYIMAIGMTFVLILGGIDLSVGSVACLAGTMVAGFLVHFRLPTSVSFILGMLIGVAAGLINGLVVSKLRLPSFIATLAMMSSARGLSLIYSGGYPIVDFPQSAVFLGRGQVLGIPLTVIFFAVIAVLAWFVLNKTRLGRHIYAIGASEECAKLSGIHIDAVKVAVYAISGLTAAITGMLLTMRLSSSQPTLGEGMELDAITAVVLGGTSLFGGQGYIVGTIIGALFLTVLNNGLNILALSAFWQQVIKGVVLIIAVSFYEKRRK